MKLEPLHRTPERALDETRVEEAMHRGVLTCPLETPLVEIARLMAAHRVHSVVVVSGPRGGDSSLWGIVSDLDLVAAVGAGDLEAATAVSTADTGLTTVFSDESLQRAARKMGEHRVAHLVVVDPRHGKPVGILSTLDIARALAGAVEKPPVGGFYVKQLMTAPAVSVPPDKSLKEVALLLAGHRISGVPVVEDGTVLGVVSEGDIVAKERGATTRAPEGLLARLVGGDEEFTAKLAARTAADAMTSPAVTIEPWRSVAAAAALMTDRGVNRLPVVEKGRLVGIVTRADLVRAFARTDSAIERDIREEVILRSFWLSPNGLRVQVLEGEVTLAGEVENELVAELLPREAQRVPGVISVRSELTVRRAPKVKRPVRQRFSTPA